MQFKLDYVYLKKFIEDYSIWLVLGELKFGWEEVLAGKYFQTVWKNLGKIALKLF